MHLLTTKNFSCAQVLYEFHIKAGADLGILTAYFATFIKQTVGETKKEFFEDSEGKDIDSIKVIERLMENRKLIFSICSDVFKGKKSIHDSAFLTLQSEFSKVNNFPKMLAAYIDNFIVQNGKTQSSEVPLSALKKLGNCSRH